MRNGIVHVLRNITTCLVGITLIGCAGCGVAVDQQDTKQPTGSAGSDTSKSKIANSIPDYIDFLLDLDAKPDTKYPMSDAQKTILKRSRKSGSVSKPDYELAWSNYKQCVTSYGYTTPVLRQFSNGLYMIAMRDTTGMSDQQRKKFNEDENKCYNTEVIAVTGVYQMQIGNPSMLSDGDQAMVDCLHKAGIVPKNYDKEAYKKDLDAHAKTSPPQWISQTRKCKAVGWRTARRSETSMTPISGSRSADHRVPRHASADDRKPCMIWNRAERKRSCALGGIELAFLRHERTQHGGSGDRA